MFRAVMEEYSVKAQFNNRDEWSRALMQIQTGLTVTNWDLFVRGVAINHR